MNMTKKIRPVERAYIAGIFDGEGCVHFRDEGTGRPVINISQKDPSVLHWVQKTLGYGNIYPARRDGDIVCWYLVFTSRQSMLDFVAVVLKHSRVKRKKLLEVKSYYQEKEDYMAAETRRLAKLKEKYGA